MTTTESSNRRSAKQRILLRGILVGFAAISLLGPSGCNEKPVPTKAVNADSAICGQLDSLMTSLADFTSLVEEASWEEMQPSLEQLTSQLRTNLDARSDSCSFFNMKLHPDVDRFGFVEMLKMRITEDSIPQGILYLIKLRGIFCVDKEVAEFMSEEMAHVAADNPAVFLEYYLANPGQQELLLHSTRWHNVNTDTLVHRFGRMEGGDPIAAYLVEWQLSRQGIPDL